VIAWSQADRAKRWAVAIGFSLAITLGGVQWYAYDAAHRQAEHFSYYVLTLTYLFGVLTPVVVRLSHRWPINLQTWRCAVPLHLLASLLLTGLGVFVEGAIGWYPHASRWSFGSAERHYFQQHTQISLTSYWMLVAVVHLYRTYDRFRLRELRASQLEAQVAAAHLASLRAQLQPHFLFNTLQAATTLIYSDPEGAEEVLLSLSELLRSSLQTLDQQEVPLGSEIEFLQHYATIQQRRFEDRLRFTFQIEAQCRSCGVPTLLLQPLVENAVQHGIGTRKQSDVISIRAFVQNCQLTIEIQNLTSSMEETFEMLVSRGVGLSNTIARLKSLYGAQQSFTMQNLSPSGVAVSVSIPARPLLNWEQSWAAQAV
jgi:hypothetical protein